MRDLTLPAIIIGFVILAGLSLWAWLKPPDRSDADEDAFFW